MAKPTLMELAKQTGQIREAYDGLVGRGHSEEEIVIILGRAVGLIDQLWEALDGGGTEQTIS